MVVTFIFAPLNYTCRVLDNKRLNKQKVEAKEILDATMRTSGGWINHPAVNMWRGYANGLKYYFNRIVEECIKRGFNNTMHIYEFTQQQLDNIHYETIEEYIESKNQCKNQDKNQNQDQIIMPWWFTWPPLLYSHRCSLLRKMPIYYERFFSKDCLGDYLDRGYIWPTNLSHEQILNFDPSYCAPIGTGAPANYRWTVEQVKEWQLNPLINPKTGRKIKESKKGIYGDLVKAEKIFRSINIIP